jgi:ABC-type sugar transport system permease subunit
VLYYEVLCVKFMSVYSSLNMIGSHAASRVRALLALPACSNPPLIETIFEFLYKDNKFALINYLLRNDPFVLKFIVL